MDKEREKTRKLDDFEWNIERALDDEYQLVDQDHEVDMLTNIFNKNKAMK